LHDTQRAASAPSPPPACSLGRPQSEGRVRSSANTYAPNWAQWASCAGPNGPSLRAGQSAPAGRWRTQVRRAHLAAPVRPPQVCTLDARASYLCLPHDGGSRLSLQLLRLWPPVVVAVVFLVPVGFPRQSNSPTTT